MKVSSRRIRYVRKSRRLSYPGMGEAPRRCLPPFASYRLVRADPSVAGVDVGIERGDAQVAHPRFLDPRRGTEEQRDRDHLVFDQVALGRGELLIAHVWIRLH